MSRRVSGQVLVRPASDPKGAFEREIDAALQAGESEQAYGLCIGLALIWCKPVEELWAAARQRAELGALL